MSHHYFNRLVHSIVLIFTGIFLLMGMAGCQEKTTTNGTVPAPTPTTTSTNPPETNSPPIETTTPSSNGHLQFTLPSGWEINPEVTYKARWPHASHDGKTPEVVLEFFNSFEGNEKDAKQAAEKDAEENKVECSSDPECTVTPGYEEINTGKYTIYVSLGEDYSWGESSWRSVLYFVKKGRVFIFTLGDRPEYYKQALDQLVETLR